jgi:hypothetical protein
MNDCEDVISWASSCLIDTRTGGFHTHSHVVNDSTYVNVELLNHTFRWSLGSPLFALPTLFPTAPCDYGLVLLIRISNTQKTPPLTMSKRPGVIDEGTTTHPSGTNSTIDKTMTEDDFIRVPTREEKRKQRKMEKQRPQFSFDMGYFKHGKKVGIAVSDCLSL